MTDPFGAVPVAVLGLADVLALLADRPRSAPLALVLVPGGIGLAVERTGYAVPGSPADLVAALEAALDPRWVWWDAPATLAPLVAGGVRLRACWDVAAVHRLRHGGRRADAGAAWAAEHDLPQPAEPSVALDLLDLASSTGAGPVGADGQLSREWVGPWAEPTVLRAATWALLCLQVQQSQRDALSRLSDGRAQPTGVPLAVLTAWSESGAALLATELAADGLPLDRPVLSALLRELVGPSADQEGARDRRDRDVLAHFPDTRFDLRNPLQVRELLVGLGFDVPDTRSWRLEPFRSTSPGVDALLRWRKVERIATTYGWSWLDRQVGPDDRLRGEWVSADGGAGRMTASAGLHNLPTDLRVAVAARTGWSLVRADLGQIEPRVLAAVSGDAALAEAGREDDLYAPVAAALSVDRPTAKIAVLAAMYGQTSGSAGDALKRMDLAYPVAMAYLRAAEDSGRAGRDLRTWGGRRIRLGVEGDPGGRGRYARNAMVQGAAAELFKAWAGTVRAGLRPLGGEIVLCLHDELLLHVPAELAPAAADLLRTALAATAAWWCAGSGVRFVADVSVVQRWSDVKG